MKKIYGIAFASAALMLASCSNESEPGGPNVNQPEGPSKYLAVNIMNAPGTRAEEDPEYKVGYDDENQVNSCTFVVLSQWNGTSNEGTYRIRYIANLNPESKPGDGTTNGWTPSGNYPNTVEKIGNPVLVIPANVVDGNPYSGNENAGTVPNDIKIAVLLNFDSSTIGTGTSEEDFLKKIVDVSATPTAGAFLMTNSAYLSEDGSEVRLTSVPTTHLMNSEEAAKLNPVDIYVERANARVDIRKTIDSNLQSDNKMYWQNDNQREYELKPTIQGLAFFGDPSNSFMIKNITGWDTNWLSTSAVLSANDYNNFRSYWATMPNGMNSDKNLEVPYFTFNSAVAANAWNGENPEGKTEITKYLRENTLGQTNAKKATKVMVLAQLKAFKGDKMINIKEDGTEEEVTDAAQHKGIEMANVFGQFTTKAGAANIIANQLNSIGYRKHTTTGEGADLKHVYTELTGADLVWQAKANTGEYSEVDIKIGNTTKTVNKPGYEVEEGNGNRTYFKLADGIVLYKFNGQYNNGVPQFDQTDKATEVNNKLKTDKVYTVSYWKSGYCYYYTDIKHLPFGVESTVNTTGVVRNHIYDITFTAINGFGTPVFDPDEIIIPTEPIYEHKDQVMLAARVKIHQWRVVKQSTVLGK